MNAKAVSGHSTDLMMAGVCFFLGAINVEFLTDKVYVYGIS